MFRVLGFGFRISGFGFLVLGFGLEVPLVLVLLPPLPSERKESLLCSAPGSGFGGLVFFVQNFGLRVSSLGYRVSSTRCSTES